MTKLLRPNLYDRLKIIAIVTMVIDHVGLLYFPDQIGRRLVGRTAFPLFLFLVGYNHSYRRRTELWLRGIVLQLLLRIGGWFDLTDIWHLNILLAIGMVRVILDRRITGRSDLRVGVLFGLAVWRAVPTSTYIDYGTMSLAFAILGYRARIYRMHFPVLVLITGLIGYHLRTMYALRAYPIDWRMLVVGVCLWCCLVWMSYENTPLQTGSHLIDVTTIWISSQALRLYVAQAVLLGGIAALTILWM